MALIRGAVEGAVVRILDGEFDDDFNIAQFTVQLDPLYEGESEQLPAISWTIRETPTEVLKNGVYGLTYATLELKFYGYNERSLYGQMDRVYNIFHGKRIVSQGSGATLQSCAVTIFEVKPYTKDTLILEGYMTIEIQA